MNLAEEGTAGGSADDEPINFMSGIMQTDQINNNIVQVATRQQYKQLETLMSEYYEFEEPKPDLSKANKPHKKADTAGPNMLFNEVSAGKGQLAK